MCQPASTPRWRMCKRPELEDEDLHASRERNTGTRDLLGPMAALLNVSKPSGIM